MTATKNSWGGTGTGGKGAGVSTQIPNDAYVAIAQHGTCRVCGGFEDLRCGACFNCSEYVDGHEIPGGHELWDKRNPENRWKVLVN